MKKFYAIIGNPPYNEEQGTGDQKNFAPPIYDRFIDESNKISDKVELIHPARFLFRQGSTPKAWNEKMLSDDHFKVVHYEPDSKVVFPGLTIPIKGGVAITLHDKSKSFGAIGTFTSYRELNTIMNKTKPDSEESSLMSIIYIQNRFNLETLLREHPECRESIGSDGKDSRFEKNSFVKTPVFTKSPESEDSIKTIGTIDSKRTWRYISAKYVDNSHENLTCYKVVLPATNGNGDIGETFANPIVCGPSEAFTRSFISIGAFDNKTEAENTLKYIKTKFCRVLLHVLKVTQMNNRETWRYVPLQNFSVTSDIDWSKSIHEIDMQLYKKYSLDSEEITFIESHVKEMT